MSTKVPPALLLNNKIPRTKVPIVNHEIDKGVYQKLESISNKKSSNTY